MTEIPAREPSGASVVIATYNSAGSVATVVEQVLAELKASHRPHDVLLVDDGSSDGTAREVRRLVDAHPDVTGVLLDGNFGQRNALLCGMRMSRQPIVVTMDDDLQHRPSDIESLIRAVESGIDLVYGVPEVLRHPLPRRLATTWSKRLLTGTGLVPYATAVTSFLACRRELVDEFPSDLFGSVALDRLLHGATSSVGTVRVEHHERLVGRSTYSFVKLVRHTLDLARLRPGRTSRLVLAASTVAIVASHRQVGEGWRSSAMSTAKVVAQLAAAACIGLELEAARVRFERRRPAYVIKSVHSNGNARRTAPASGCLDDPGGLLSRMSPTEGV